MATVTKPIALDESLNTTEQSSRNIADVLAQEIGNLVTVVSRIAPSTTVSWNQIQQGGTKIAQITINGTSTDVYAPTGGGGFSALIIITADAGQTVTATKGGDTYTATEVTSGTYEVTVDSAGTWTISDGTISDTIAIPSSGTYYVTLSSVPDGSTVTPTDDISIWLACGQRSEAYTTLSQVLADSTCLSALISDNNAMNYLVRSTTWASGVTADSSAMSYIGLDNYASNTLLADSTWRSAICNSAYFESVLNVKVPTMTSDTTPSGECFASSVFGVNNPAWKAFDGTYNVAGDTWASQRNSVTNQYLGYTFTNSIKVYLAKVHGHPTGANWNPKNIKFQYKVNNNWVDVPNSATIFPADVNIHSFVYLTPVESDSHRLFIVDSYTTYNDEVDVSLLQFYGRKDV